MNFIIGVKKTLLSRDHEFVNQFKKNLPDKPYCALCFRVETYLNKFLQKDNYHNGNVLSEMIHIALSEWVSKFLVIMKINKTFIKCFRNALIPMLIYASYVGRG